MKYISTRSLNGTMTNTVRRINGSQVYSSGAPIIIRKLKEKFFNLIVIPLIQDNTKMVIKNSFLLPNMKRKFREFENIYKNQDLAFYNQLVQLIETLIERIEEYEDYVNKISELNDGIGDFRVRIHRIRLLAQYEIYNMIFDPPAKGQVYDDIKIGFIKQTIKNDNLGFDDIEKIVLSEFPL